MCSSDLPWKTCVGNATFAAMFADLIAGLGEYPHAALGVADSRTQSTRMLKAFCPECSYTVRLTSKWATVGLPSCPVDSIPFTLETLER